jgi:hypothetical protein
VVSAAPGRRLRAEVTDQFGTVAEILDLGTLLGALSPWKREQLSFMADGLVKDIAAVLGGNEDHARKVAVAELIRLVADEDAYERVAERRGVLPL